MKINIDTLALDIDRERARRAYNNISFRPETRGDSVVTGYVSTLESLALHIENYAKDPRQEAIAQEVFDGLRAKYRTKTLDWLGAKSRCISSAITGGSNFPVRRAEKANQSEHNKMMELFEFSKAMRSYAEKSLDRVFPREEIAADDIAKLKALLDNRKQWQEFMKAANAAHRRKDESGLKKLFEDMYKSFDDANAALAAFLKPNYMNSVGFERFEMSNNLANIKRMEERLAVLESKAVKAETVGEEAQALKGLQVVRNHSFDRLQLIFDGKPDEEIRTLLKRNGFKWSPSNGAWQRQLTPNAESALKDSVLSSPLMAQHLA